MLTTSSYPQPKPLPRHRSVSPGPVLGARLSRTDDQAGAPRLIPQQHRHLARPGPPQPGDSRLDDVALARPFATRQVGHSHDDAPNVEAMYNRPQSRGLRREARRLGARVALWPERPAPLITRAGRGAPWRAPYALTLKQTVALDPEQR
eukprot:scaffold574_cov92-Isochrysis_galbana.AAC.3